MDESKQEGNTRTFRPGACLFLMLLGGVLIAGNLWYTAARSTIPLAIEGVVRRVELRTEKKRGIDDVFLLTLEDGRVIQLDRMVFDVAKEGVRLRKAAWSTELSVDGEAVPLVWSRDFRRMRIVMPLVGAAMLAACGWMFWPRGRRDVPTAN